MKNWDLSFRFRHRRTVASLEKCTVLIGPCPCAAVGVPGTGGERGGLEDLIQHIAYYNGRQIRLQLPERKLSKRYSISMRDVHHTLPHLNIIPAIFICAKDCGYGRRKYINWLQQIRRGVRWRQGRSRGLSSLWVVCIVTTCPLASCGIVTEVNRLWWLATLLYEE